MDKPDLLIRWRRDPRLFVRECIGAVPDAWQDDVLFHFGNPACQRIAMPASKGPGKSAVLAWCCWNFLLTRPMCKIACTSISSDNLADGLWTELAKWQQQSETLSEAFLWSKTRIQSRESPATWWASARAWPRSADRQQQADTLSGLHADYLLFILDEAGGIPDAVGATAEAGLATGIESKLVIAGNCTALDGVLYRAAVTERDRWYIREVSGDPDDPMRSPRVSIEWARDQIAKWGRDNPWVRVNVLGKFPQSSLNALLSVDDVDAAMRRQPPLDQYEHAQRRIGIDVARFGDDRTIIFRRQGLATWPPDEMRGARSHEIAARALKHHMEFQSDVEFVDSTGGYGAGTEDALIMAGRPPVPVCASGGADDPRFYNKRAECWWRMAEWVKRGGSLPQNPDLRRELTAPTYTLVRGRLLLEAKEQVKARLGFSPDIADALSLTFAHVEAPSGEGAGAVLSGARGEPSRTAADWDPLRDA